MSESTVVHSTFVIERNYSATPQQVFAAFADPVKKRRWFAEGEGFEVDMFEMDFRIGGAERARFRFKPGASLEQGTACANDSYYLDIVANLRIVIAYTMTIGDKRISASLSTFEIFPAGGASEPVTNIGARLVFTEQAAFFEGADGPQRRQSGWRQLFDRLQAELAG